ncbi:uncharacterized protein LOC128964101 [Oppia nitens]|uniref:uncharacterized protein LOC128964101 n=1 Tax=Oppia nitens TaxID=1686743 RepID=UPI0023D9D341|nr:uncharacterized protein LOC128964101 [Oppia nitens]
MAYNRPNRSRGRSRGRGQRGSYRPRLQTSNQFWEQSQIPYQTHHLPPEQHGPPLYMAEGVPTLLEMQQRDQMLALHGPPLYMPEVGFPPFQGQGMPTFQGQGLPPFQGQGMPTFQGQGLPSFQGQGMPPFQGQGMPTFQGQGMPPFQGQGMPPFQGQGMPPFQGQGMPTFHQPGPSFDPSSFGYQTPNYPQPGAFTSQPPALGGYPQASAGYGSQGMDVYGQQPPVSSESPTLGPRDESGLLRPLPDPTAQDQRRYGYQRTTYMLPSIPTDQPPWVPTIGQQYSPFTVEEVQPPPMEWSEPPFRQFAPLPESASRYIRSQTPRPPSPPAQRPRSPVPRPRLPTPRPRMPSSPQRGAESRRSPSPRLRILTRENRSPITDVKSRGGQQQQQQRRQQPGRRHRPINEVWPTPIRPVRSIAPMLTIPEESSDPQIYRKDFRMFIDQDLDTIPEESDSQ